MLSVRHALLPFVLSLLAGSRARAQSGADDALAALRRQLTDTGSQARTASAASVRPVVRVPTATKARVTNPAAVPASLPATLPATEAAAKAVAAVRPDTSHGADADAYRTMATAIVDSARQDVTRMLAAAKADIQRQRRLQLPAASAPVTLASKSRLSVRTSASLRSRVEDWRWFDTTAAGAYSYSALLARVGVQASRGSWSAKADLSIPVLLSLPTGASAPAPLGQFGLGANYASASTSGAALRSNVAGLFVRQAVLEWKQRTTTVRLGRFDVSDGVERTPTAPALATLKNTRLSQRLLGAFGFTHGQRAMDGDRWAGGALTVWRGAPRRRVHGAPSRIVRTRSRLKSVRSDAPHPGRRGYGPDGIVAAAIATPPTTGTAPSFRSRRHRAPTRVSPSTTA